MVLAKIDQRVEKEHILLVVSRTASEIQKSINEKQGILEKNVTSELVVVNLERATLCWKKT